MFGFQGGEDADTLLRKKQYLKEAQRHWRFLTHYDLSTIKTKGQLCNMIKIRKGLSEEQATKDVDNWMQGKEF
ncbi:hypothetical protein [Thalassospira lucentensis]|uniref:Uncharacterized protein n=1 Tax=Thalassospira lucentensis TaxID=168935 RepID=A0A358HRD0_9PROT|nr:hypothetical protein [Thalassospira lucentensis]HBU97710.1 hypothetical protein [Thalassospira lucentensis]HCW67943.1 hypothetical protein [Thalassospira lucentensis]|tara:strand:+ start:2157 stop:2375 length:219 start_codon:yes stop_codon:yes gene_type:complete